MIRVRIAPSPTGLFHIGTARTALFNWLYARHHGGQFIVRIEDTDRERSKSEYEDDILAGLQWLGLEWDEGPGREITGPSHQRERISLYSAELEKLLNAGSAYRCYCTMDELEAERTVAEVSHQPYRYSGRCRVGPPKGRDRSVIRFRIPESNEPIEWNDLVRGPVRFERDALDDVIIAKSLDEPLYNFAVVVDDAAMQITHVIRGEDHISNTPKQILMARALGYAEPQFGHFPLILNPDHSKMSKRFNNVAVSWYRSQGYLAEAMVNFLALLGWNPGGERELYSTTELISVFDIDRVQKSGAIFNEQKLRWFNKEYLNRLSLQEFLERAEPFIPALEARVHRQKAISVVRPRVEVLNDLTTPLESLFGSAIVLKDPTLLIWSKLKKTITDPAEQRLKTRLALAQTKVFLSSQKDWSEASLEAQLKEWITTESLVVGEILWPLRVSLSGANDSPNPFELMEACGRELSIDRIDYALRTLE